MPSDIRTVLIVIVLGAIVSSDVNHTDTLHKIRHRHDYYSHIRRYLQLRRERLPHFKSQTHVAQIDQNSDTSYSLSKADLPESLKSLPTESEGMQHDFTTQPTFSDSPTTTTSTPTTRKYMRKLKHYFYPKSFLSEKIEKLAEDTSPQTMQTPSSITELPPTTHSSPPISEIISEKAPESDDRSKEKPDPEKLLRVIGESESEVDHFRKSQSEDWLHHTASQPREDITKISKSQKGKPIPPANADDEAIESFDDLSKDLVYNDAKIPILNRPIFEFADSLVEGDDDFHPVALPSGFRHYDIDQDGFVSLNELILIAGTAENVEEAFKVADTDGDELISKREFHRAPWMLSGDPIRNSELTKIKSKLESESAQMATKLHLPYVPQITLNDEPDFTRVDKVVSGSLKNRESSLIQNSSPNPALSDNGHHPSPLGLWDTDVNDAN